MRRAREDFSISRAMLPRSPPAQRLSLHNRFLNWYRSLPEFTRNRAFSMSKFETALKSQGKHISPVLLELGWQRKRIWSTTGHYLTGIGCHTPVRRQCGRGVCDDALLIVTHEKNAPRYLAG
jgi:hypothetical protein